MLALPRLREMVPVVVMVPPERPVPATMEVTVPEPAPLPIQVPLMAKQPPERSTPRAKVEVAEVPVTFRYVACTPEAKVEVAAVPCTTR